MKVFATNSSEAFLKISHEVMSRFRDQQQRGKEPDMSVFFLSNFISRGVVHCNGVGRIPTQRQDVRELLTMTLEVMFFPMSGFTELPSEVLQHMMQCDSTISVDIWKNTSFSEETHYGMVMQQAQEKIPALFVHDEHFSEKVHGRAEDHTVWLTVRGKFMETIEVIVKALIPGRSPTKLQVSERDRNDFADVSTEFEILRVLHGHQKHQNIAQLIAFSTVPPLMFAVEYYETTLLQRLYIARGKNEVLSIQWKVDRCLEMIRAIHFLHHHDVIHREIMTSAFSLNSHEVAILTSLSRAAVNDEAGISTTVGHVRGAVYLVWSLYTGSLP